MFREMNISNCSPTLLMLVVKTLQPSSSLQQQPKAPKQRPVSKPVSTTSSSHNSPSHNMDTDESCHSVGGRSEVRQPWRMTGMHSHNRAGNVGGQARSKWADVRVEEVDE